MIYLMRVCCVIALRCVAWHCDALRHCACVPAAKVPPPLMSTSLILYSSYLLLSFFLLFTCEHAGSLTSLINSFVLVSLLSSYCRSQETRVLRDARGDAIKGPLGACQQINSRHESACSSIFRPLPSLTHSLFSLLSLFLCFFVSLFLCLFVSLSLCLFVSLFRVGR